MKTALFVPLCAFVALAVCAPTPATGQNAPVTPPPAPPGIAPKASTNASVRVVDAAPTAGDPLVSMTFDETPVSDVIKAFRDATGANIISSGTNLQGNVSVRLDNVPWRKGLASILEPQGLQLVEQPIGSGIYVVNTKTVEIPVFTQTFNLNHAKADDIAKLFASTLGKNATATPFPSANVVIVTATEKQLSECEKIIATVDKPRPQVYIEARFAELSASASKKLGMRWDSLSSWQAIKVSNLSGGMEYNKGKAASYTTGGTTVRESATPVDSTYSTYTKEVARDLLVPSTITAADGAGRMANDMSWKRARGIGGQISSGDFALTMSAFEKLDGVSIFSNPKIIVANEESATVDMTTKEPNVEVQASRSGTSGDNLDITTKLAVIPGKEEPFVGESFFSYGISLKVTPRVSSTGLITVQIEPSISDKDTSQGGGRFGRQRHGLFHCFGIG